MPTPRLLLLFCAATVLSADQVVLTNGDVITGSIVRKDGDKLTLKSPILGDVTMPWSAVRSLKSSEAVTVVLPGGATTAGTIATSGATLEVAAPTGPRTVPLADVTAIRSPAEQQAWERLQHPGLRDLWTGSFDLGLALARGNARTDTLTTAANASRITRNDKITVAFNQIYGTARIGGVTSAIASAFHGGWTYNRDVTPRLFVSTLNDYEHDRFQDLDLRFVAGAGLGLNAIKSERTALAFSAGGDYSRENFSAGLNRNSAEANFGNDLLYKLSGATSVTQSFRIYPNLSNTGEYRINFNLSAVTAINKWLGWHVTASDWFLSNPVLGRQRNDLLLSTGLRLSFVSK